MNMPITLHEPEQVQITMRLALEIADESAVICIESYARRAPTNYPLGVWDVSSPDPLELRDESLQEVQKDIERAVQYLDMRARIVRPWSDSPHLVSFLRAE